MRSENSAIAGSSPLARGLHLHQLVAQPLPGIIPARAGFTRQPRTGRCAWRDHPRSRGVYGVQVRTWVTLTGSSPLARGLREGVLGRPPRPRIIPARAGFTATNFFKDLAGVDHPRSRGVYPTRPAEIRSISGSSPLARGLLPKRLRVVLRERIIPARAGFTAVAAGDLHAIRDHPRSRGVYRGRMSRISIPRGSSPLARGLPGRLWCGTRSDRIIPARAGFTVSVLDDDSCEEDHPRSRGVYAYC